MSHSLQGEVRLGDVLRIALPVDTEVHAHPSYAMRPVNWVAILVEHDNLERQVEAGDIVIFPLHLHLACSTEELAAFIESLATLSSVALVVFRPLDVASQTSADNFDLPVFVVPEHAALRDIHKNMTALLIDRQTQISERGMQLYRELSEMSREGRGLDQMAHVIGQLTGKIVVIQDKRLEIQAIARPAGSIPFDDEDMLQALTDTELLPAVLRNRKAAAKATRSHWQQLLFPHHNVARLVSPIISGDRARGYLSIIGPAGDLDLLDSVAVEQGAAACALEMAKAKAVSEAKKALRGNFLEGILAGNIPNSELERLSSRLDHDTNQPHAVMTFRWERQGGDSGPSLRRIETTVNWLLSTNNHPALVHTYGGEHVCVFQALRSPDEIGIAHRFARRLRAQLKSDYPEQRLVGGLSGPAMSLVEWPGVHQQALQAMEVGQRLQLDEVIEYNSLGVYRLLGKLDNIPAVHGFCDQVIGPLVRYDREHRSNLVQTIEEYFNHHANVSQTAESLFIHRNTLLYRLERIQELTNHDLDQADQRLALHLALKLWQLRPDK